MCGIAGQATIRGGPVPSPALLQRMCQLMVHRGPDDEGYIVRDGVGLAMRRLEIIDPEGGRQPIHNEDETIWIVFNGEIYNYPELAAGLRARGHRFYTRCDTEVVVHGYEEWGTDCVEHLNGMFAFAIWDTNTQTVFLARDRMGIKPLYYACQDGRLYFASELKPLLVDPSVPRRIDPVALTQYLALEYVPSPRSIFSGISKLPPGHTLVWHRSSGNHHVRSYWNVDLSASERAVPRESLDEQAAELRAVIKAAVRRELISDVPLGVFLSGGIDSSTIAAMMAELTPGNVNSFSIGFRDASFDESRYARTVARHLGTNHHELILEPRMLSDLIPEVVRRLDEPLGDASIIPTYLLSRFTRQHVKVALGGDGGDELFAGYPTLQAHRLMGWYQRLPALLRSEAIPALVARMPVSLNHFSLDFKAKRFVSGDGYPPAERHLRWVGSFSPEERAALLSADVHAELERDPVSDLVAEHLASQALREPLNQILYLDMKLYLEGDILVKLDRASMMASLEARVPLLNVEVVEHVARLPLCLKLRGLRSKFLLREAVKDVLPAEILERKKHGFGIPVSRWIHRELKEEFRSALEPSRIKAQGLFEPAAINRLMDDHLSGRRDNRKPLWSLFMFERWYDNFVEAPTLPLPQRGREIHEAGRVEAAVTT
jgi:asparagine synthase (glutamine-hydrolysing)